MEKNDFIEKVIGGVLGAIAIIATVIELVLTGYSPEGVAGMVKDIASTFIVVILLVAFANEHKKTKDLRGSIESEMTKLENGYFPLIREVKALETSPEAKKNKLEKVIRYEIATDTNVLFGKKSGLYSPFYDIELNSPNKIEFYVRQKFFGSKEDDIFDAEKISEKIFMYMKKQHKELNMSFLSDKSGGKIIIAFEQPLKYKKDIDVLVKIVDDMIFSYTLVKKQ